MDRRRKKLLAVGTGLAALVLSAVLWKTVGSSMLRFISEPDAFRRWVDAHGAYSRLAFIGMVIFQILIAVIPGEPFEIAAGYAFGAVEGTGLSILAAALGSMLTFGLVRLFGMRLVRLFFTGAQIDSVRFLKSSRGRDLLFLIVYMLPGTPKDLLGYFAGLTDIRLPVWLMICSFGRIPSVVTSTIGGDALGTKNYSAAIGVFAATIAVSTGGLLIYNRIVKSRREQA